MNRLKNWQKLVLLAYAVLTMFVAIRIMIAPETEEEKWCAEQRPELTYSDCAREFAY